MSDIELLELASKGANLNVDFDIWTTDGVDVWYGNDKWNPLIDDGDALRLAIKLSMHIQHLDGARESRAIAGDEWIAEGWESGKDVSTRRVIVRAAAWIGRNMP